MWRNNLVNAFFSLTVGCWFHISLQRLCSAISPIQIRAPPIFSLLHPLLFAVWGLFFRFLVQRTSSYPTLAFTRLCQLAWFRVSLAFFPRLIVVLYWCSLVCLTLADAVSWRKKILHTPFSCQNLSPIHVDLAGLITDRSWVTASHFVPRVPIWRQLSSLLPFCLR